MKNISRISLMVTAILLSSGARAAEELKIAASIAATNGILLKIKDAFEKESGIKLVFTQKDPKGGSSEEIFKLVDQDQTDIGIAAGTWESWVALMKEKNYTPKNQDIKYRVIGKDFLQFITYPGGPAELTENQIKDILLGKIKNWKQAGGEDRQVVIVLTPGQPATSKFLEDHLLEKKPVSSEGTKNLPKGSGVGELMQEVAATPGAFGFSARSAVTSAVNAPKHFEIGRPILVIHRGKPSAKMEKLLTFIKTDGAKYGVK